MSSIKFAIVPIFVLGITLGQGCLVKKGNSHINYIVVFRILLYFTKTVKNLIFTIYNSLPLDHPVTQSASFILEFSNIIYRNMKSHKQ